MCNILGKLIFNFAIENLIRSSLRLGKFLRGLVQMGLEWICFFLRFSVVFTCCLCFCALSFFFLLFRFYFLPFSVASWIPWDGIQEGKSTQGAQKVVSTNCHNESLRIQEGEWSHRNQKGWKKVKRGQAGKGRGEPPWHLLLGGGAFGKLSAYPFSTLHHCSGQDPAGSWAKVAGAEADIIQRRGIIPFGMIPQEEANQYIQISFRGSR